MKDGEKVQPQITADNYEVNYAKDVWLMAQDERDENDKEQFAMQSIAKSSKDEYLVCNSVDLSEFEMDPTPENLKKLPKDQTKIKAQYTACTYPLIVSNLGTKALHIQTLA